MTGIIAAIKQAVRMWIARLTKRGVCIWVPHPVHLEYELTGCGHVAGWSSIRSHTNIQFCPKCGRLIEWQ